MIVYDVNKSRYGLNPLKCFRLSEKAVSALSLNDTRTFLRNLVHEKIRDVTTSVLEPDLSCPVWSGLGRAEKAAPAPTFKNTFFKVFPYLLFNCIAFLKTI